MGPRDGQQSEQKREEEEWREKETEESVHERASSKMTKVGERQANVLSTKREPRERHRHRHRGSKGEEVSTCNGRRFQYPAC